MDLVKFLFSNAAFGFAIGVAGVALILAMNVLNLGTLVSASAIGVGAASLLAIAMGLTCAVAQIAFALSEVTNEQD